MNLDWIGITILLVSLLLLLMIWRLGGWRLATGMEWGWTMMTLFGQPILISDLRQKSAPHFFPLFF